MKKCCVLLCFLMLFCASVNYVAAFEYESIGSATDLQWNMRSVPYNGVTTEKMGCVTWKYNPPFGEYQKYIVSFYKVGEDKPIYTERGDVPKNPVSGNSMGFANCDPESGSYYFTVRLTGDLPCGENSCYGSVSEIAVSDIFEYEKPEKKMVMPQDVQWEKNTYSSEGNGGLIENTYYDVVWSNEIVDNNGAITGNFLVELYYAKEINEKPIYYKTFVGGAGTPDQLDFELAKGSGYYFMRAKSLSDNIIECANSDWSPLSKGIYYEESLNETTERLNQKIGQPLDRCSRDAQAFYEVLASYPEEEVKLAMSATENPLVANRIASLEKNLSGGNATSIMVESGFDDFDTSLVSVTGAMLNELSDPNSAVTLSIGPVDQEHAISDAYDNAVAIQFGMDLDNIENSSKLRIPVIIRIPIPEEMDPERLVMIHYLSNGMYEEIIPNTMIVDDVWFADFLVDGFSDFVITEYNPDWIAAYGVFSDISRNWAYEGIDYCYNQQLMNGVGNAKFDPGGYMTRAMAVTVLYRLAGAPEGEGTSQFIDVEMGQWYSDAINWAASNRIVNGVGDHKFAPNENITREQMAAILMRYTNEILKLEPSPSIQLNSYRDYTDVSDYAKLPMAWAVDCGLIKGSLSKGELCLLPRDNATRAQMATILMRFCKNI